jgi:catalase
MGNTNNSFPDLVGSKDWKDKLKEISDSEVNKLVDAIDDIQDTVADKKRKPPIKTETTILRGFHAKGFGMSAKFKIRHDVPSNVRVGLFAEGGKEFDAIIRFSNAFSVNQKDSELDQRGLAIRVFLDSNPASENIQDFLMTNTPVSFGKDAKQFVKVSKFLVDHSKLVAFTRILLQPKRLRILRQLFTGIKTPSMAAERYWSRTPFQIGDYAMKFMVQLSETADQEGIRRRWKSKNESVKRWGAQDYLREELLDLLKQLQQEGKTLKFDFRIQLYQNEKRTPMENPSREWKESDAPFTTLAELEILNKDISDKEIEKMTFSPWNTKDFEPLGTMNKARKLVYDKSAEKRGGSPLSIGR